MAIVDSKNGDLNANNYQIYHILSFLKFTNSFCRFDYWIFFSSYFRSTIIFWLRLQGVSSVRKFLYIAPKFALNFSIKGRIPRFILRKCSQPNLILEGKFLVFFFISFYPSHELFLILWACQPTMPSIYDTRNILC